MDGQFTIPDNTRVRLLGHIDGSFYNGMAKTGNEGWITKHRVDSHGLPEAYIQWDRDHWADNKQPNMWTYEEHFESIPAQKETRMSAANIDKDQLWEFFQAFSYQGAEDGPAEAEPLDEVEEAMWMHYDEQAARATDILENAEAFFIVGVQRDEENTDAPGGQLIISMAGSSVSPETDALVGSQMAEVASRYHKNAAYTIVQHLTEDVTD